MLVSKEVRQRWEHEEALLSSYEVRPCGASAVLMPCQLTDC